MIANKKEEMLKFQVEIVALVEKTNCSYIDAILLFCEMHDVEPERIPILLSPVLISKIEEEASDLNMIKDSKPKTRL